MTRPTTDNISGALANFVVETRFEHLDACAAAQTRYALLDGLGVSLAATTLGEGCQAFVDLVIAQQAHPESRIFGTDYQTSAAQAAFANGALSHALDFEDAHDLALVHPNAAVIPAALAVAEALGPVSGRELLTAIAVGCDVVCRLGLALRVPLDDYGWYPPPILSAFGATAAVAKLYQLNADQVRDAFSLTLLQATCSAEIKYNPRSQIRAIRDAFPAQAGVLSAQLAVRGINGFEQPFEGAAGLFALFARGKYAPEALLEDLGTRFEISNLSFKPWPSCRGTHVFVEGMLALGREHDLRADDIARIDVCGNRINRMLVEPVVSKCKPSTAIDAKFSIPFCVASAAVHGELNLEHFFATALSDSAVLKLTENVHYHVDESLGTDPSAMTTGHLQVSLHDGREYSFESKNAYGCPARPLTQADILKKFCHCCQLAAKPIPDEQLAESILTLDTADDLHQALFDHL